MEHEMRPLANVRAELLKFARKSYRDGFLHTQVRGGVAFQLKALRDKFKLSQSEFALKIGKPQSVVSRLENTEYGKVSIQTLLDIASATDVALLVKFVSYPNFLRQTSDMSPAALQPETIFESIEREETAPAYVFAAVLTTRRSDAQQQPDYTNLVTYLRGYGAPSPQQGAQKLHSMPYERVH